tara:strand:- start:20776 stop:26445 length:5670 start_codon:yes stop_codon:yes gene_type:complete
MAKKKVTIDVEVNGKMEKVTLSSKKLREELDNVDQAADQSSKSARTLDRNIKGAANASSNASKNFSKMSQGMGGLVGVYASLAANLFALSAAFNFMKNAAQVQQLEQAQLRFAASTGNALSSVTHRLRETSQGMLGFREAAQAAAIGTAKGFSPSQLNKLAEGALRASNALGRDFADAFDRLVRGVSKAEPELLDELGITLRLETATKRYADALGLQADALTETQRSQAVLVETQRQLDQIFGNQEATANPFITLSKAFEDLIKTITEAFLPIFTVIANVVSNSIGVAVGLLGIFAFNVLKGAGATTFLADKLDSVGEAASAAFDKAEKDIKDYNKQLELADDAQEKVRKSAKKTFEKQAKQALKGGAQSKLLEKVKGDGFDSLNKKELGQLKRFLRLAEENSKKTGRVMSGAFENMSTQAVQDMRKALAQIDDRTKKSANFFSKQWTKANLRFRKAIAFSDKQMAKFLRGAGTGIAALSKKLSGFASVFKRLGIAYLFIQIALEVVKGIDSLILLTLEGVDFMINSISQAVAGIDLSNLSGAYADSDLREIIRAPGQMIKEFENARDAADDAAMAVQQLDKDFSGLVSGLQSEEATRMELMASNAETAAQDIVDSMARSNSAIRNFINTAEISNVARQIEEVAALDGFGANARAEEVFGNLSSVLADFQKDLGGVIPGLAELDISNRADVIKFFDELGKKTRLADNAIKHFESSNEALGEAIRDGDIFAMSAAFDKTTEALTAADVAMGEQGENFEGAAEAIAVLNVEFANTFDIAKMTRGEFETFIKTAVDETNRLIKKEKELAAEQVKNAAMRNSFDSKRSTLLTAIAQQENTVAQIQRKIANERGLMKGMAEGTADKAAAEQRILALQNELIVENAKLEVAQKDVGFKTQILDIEEQIRSVRLDGRVLNLQNELNSALSKEASQRKQLLDLKVQQANAQVEDIAEENALRNPFFEKDRFLAEEKLKLVQQEVAARTIQIEEERKLKNSQITMEYDLLDNKRKQTLLELKLLQKQIKGGVYGDDTGTLAGDVDGLIDMYGENGALAQSYARAESAAIRINDETAAAAQNDLKRMERSAQRTVERLNPITDILFTAAKAFKSSMVDAVDAMFDSLSDKTMDLDEKLKDIARNFLKVIQRKASEVLVDEIFRALGLAGTSPAKKITTAHATGATQMSTAITTSGTAHANAVGAQIAIAGVSLGNQIRDALAEGVKVCCCEENVVDSSTIEKAGKTVEEALGGGAEEVKTGIQDALNKDVLTNVMPEPEKPEFLKEIPEDVMNYGKKVVQEVADTAEKELTGALDNIPQEILKDMEVPELLPENPKFIDKVKGLFSETGPIAGIFSTVGGFFKNIFSGKGEGGGVFKGLFTGIKNIFTGLFSGGGEGGIFSGLFSKFTGFFTDLFKGEGGGLFCGAFDGVKRFFGKLFSSDGPISSFFTKTGNFFKNLLGPSGPFPGFFKGFKDFFTGLIDGFKNFFGKIFGEGGFLSNVIQGIGKLLPNFSGVVQGAKDFFGKIFGGGEGGGLGGIFEKIKGFFGSIFSGGEGGTGGFFSNIISKVTGLFSSGGEGGGFFSNIISKVTGLFTGEGAGGGLGGIFSKILGGFTGGMGGGLGGLLDPGTPLHKKLFGPKDKDYDTGNHPLGQVTEDMANNIAELVYYAEVENQRALAQGGQAGGPLGMLMGGGKGGMMGNFLGSFGDILGVSGGAGGGGFLTQLTSIFGAKGGGGFLGSLGSIFGSFMGGGGMGGGGILSMLANFIPGVGPFLSMGLGMLGFKHGGIMGQGGNKISGYNRGGIANGPMSGYPAVLHGNEAVVPLPGNNKIPVELKGSGMNQQNNNVTVNVSVDGNGNANQSVEMKEGESEMLGKAISIAVQNELANQRRAGGMLSPYGAG